MSNEELAKKSIRGNLTEKDIAEAYEKAKKAVKSGCGGCGKRAKVSIKGK